MNGSQPKTQTEQKTSRLLQTFCLLTIRLTSRRTQEHKGSWVIGCGLTWAIAMALLHW